MQNPAEATVSVLIPAYNAEPFLERAVASAFSQTLGKVEVVIVDDASTDSTLTLARDIARSHAHVRVVALERNGGPSVARNAAIRAARGRWLAILDADDAYAPEHLDGLVRLAEARQADVVLSNFRYFDPEGKWEGGPALPTEPPPTEPDRYAYVDQARPFAETPDWGLLKPLFSGTFLRRHALAYPAYCRHGEDFLLMMEAYLLGARVVLSRAPSYLYTHRASGWSRTRVDYTTQIADTGALLHDPRIKDDERLCDGLRGRMKALERLSIEHKVRGLWERRALGALALESLADPKVGMTTARFARAKLQAALQ